MPGKEKAGTDRYLEVEVRLENLLSELRVSEIQIHAICEPFFSKYTPRYESNSSQTSALSRINSLANDIMIISSDAKNLVETLAHIMLEGQK